MQRVNTLTRQIHDLLQGSDAWHAFRFDHHGASEAAAMLGLSTKVSRTELVRMKATGLAKEFSDFVQENILDHGHEVEALARPFAEKIIGDVLYPITISLGAESASCDGLTLDEAVGFEHKQWNRELAASLAANVLPDEHQPQVQQQLMVSGAEKWLFMTSDGTEDNMVWMWVYPDTTWFERIVAGWPQFDIDVDNYKQVDHAEKPVAEPIAALPALVVQTEGKVVSSNLAAYKFAAEKFIAKININLETDEHFADAENTVKFCGEAEAKLELAKAAALAQTSTIDEVMRTVDHIKEQFRTKRLQLEKLVKVRKEQIKETILNEGKREFVEHVAALEKEIAPLRLALQQPDFAGAMKGKRTLASLHDAVNTTLANAKITSNTMAADYRAKQTWCKENAAGHGALFMDMATIITKPMDDFQLVVNTRVAAHLAAEKAKEEALRAQIAAQEKAKADAVIAEAARVAQAEADRQAAAAVEAERGRVAAETKRQMEAQQATIAAERQANERAAGQQVTHTRETALSAARASLTSAAAANVAANATPAAEVPASAAPELARTSSFYGDAPRRAAPAPAAAPADLFDAAETTVDTDIEFLSSLADAKDMPLADLIDRITAIDFEAVSAELTA